MSMLLGWILVSMVLIVIVSGLNVASVPNEPTSDLGFITLKGGGRIRERMIPISLIDPNPKNPRNAATFDPRKNVNFANLLASIQQHGVIPGKEPLVRETGNGRYVLIEGHMRTKAASQAGLSELNCRVLPADAITPAEETRMVLDHGTATGLTDAEQFVAFQQCWNDRLGRRTTCRLMNWTKKEDDGSIKNDDNTYNKFASYMRLPLQDRAVVEAYLAGGKDATMQQADGSYAPMPYVPTGDIVKALVKAIDDDAKAATVNPTIGMLPVEARPAYEAAKIQVSKPRAERAKRYTTADFEQKAQSDSACYWINQLWLVLAGKSTRTLTEVMEPLYHAHDLAYGVPIYRARFDRPDSVDAWLKTLADANVAMRPFEDAAKPLTTQAPNVVSLADVIASQVADAGPADAAPTDGDAVSAPVPVLVKRPTPVRNRADRRTK